MRLSNTNEHFEPTANTKKAWAATEQQALDGRHSGLFGKQALTGVFLVFALAAEIWGAYALAQRSGYSLKLTVFAPVLWCLLWAFVGHYKAWKNRLYTAELEVVEGRQNEEDRNRAAKLRSLLLPWVVWRWVARVPILLAPGLFYYFYDVSTARTLEPDGLCHSYLLRACGRSAHVQDGPGPRKHLGSGCNCAPIIRRSPIRVPTRTPSLTAGVAFRSCPKHSPPLLSPVPPSVHRIG